MIEYLNAVTQGHPTIRSFLNDMFRAVVIVSHGSPLPPISEIPPL